MTRYEILQLIFSALTFSAAVVVACIYGCQLSEMTKSTEAATKAAKAAKDSVELARQTAHHDLRAWVTVDQVTSEPSASLPEGRIFKVIYKNTGKTPAVKVHVWIKQSEQIEDIPEQDPNSENTPRMILGPSVIGNTSTVDKPIPAALAHAIEAGKLWYVSGTIWYEDIFGKPHWTQFAFRVGPDFKGFGPIAVHNGCDDCDQN